MLEFIKNLFKTEERSKDVAKNRLKVVIMQQKSNISKLQMDELKTDLIAVFKKYLEIDEAGLEVNVGEEKDTIGLSISIPVKEVKVKK